MINIEIYTKKQDAEIAEGVYKNYGRNTVIYNSTGVLITDKRTNADLLDDAAKLWVLVVW